VSIGCRVFILDEKNNLHRIAVKRFERLVLHHNSSESFPEFAGQRVRYAFVILEVENRKPVTVSYVDYAVLQIDDEGKLDTNEQHRAMRLGFDMLPSFISKVVNSPVIDGNRYFSRKRYEHEFRWQPSSDIKEAIVTSIFGKKEKPLKLV
jgi:transposase